MPDKELYKYTLRILNINGFLTATTVRWTKLKFTFIRILAKNPIPVGRGK
jgi:hypothetical protein